MVNALLVRKIVGIIGNVISFFLFLSPVPTYVKICRRKSVEEFSFVPYLAAFLNCVLWIFYGMPFVTSNNTLVYTINGVGLALEIIYLIIFLIYATGDKRRKLAISWVGAAAFAALVIGVVLGVVHQHSKRSLVLGIFAMIFSICMYGSPLVVMRMVIQTRSVKYMPFFLSLAGFLNGLCWFGYAFLQFDIFILIPNGLGALFGLAQLVLYLCYFRATPVEGEKKTKAVQITKAVQMKAFPNDAANNV